MTEADAKVQQMTKAAGTEALELAKVRAVTERKTSLHSAAVKVVALLVTSLVFISLIATAALVEWGLPSIRDNHILDTCTGHPDPAKCVFDVKRVIE